MREEILYCVAFYLWFIVFYTDFSILHPISLLPISFFSSVISFSENNLGEQIEAILFKDDGKGIPVETH